MPKVISLELAKELDGVAQEHGVALPESEYSYCQWFEDWGITKRKKWLPHPVKLWIDDYNFETMINSVPAYQTDELLEWMKTTTHLVKQEDNEIYMASTAEIEIELFADTPRNALAKLAIYILTETDLRRKN